MDYKECFTMSVIFFIAFGMFFVLSILLFFKLDIKSIVKIFLRKLKVVIIVLVPVILVFKPVNAKDDEGSYSEARFKTKIFSLGVTNFYKDLNEEYFTFFVTVNNPERVDSIEVYVDKMMCYKSLPGDNLRKEIPIMLKKGYEPKEIVLVNRAKSGNTFENIYKLEKDDEGPFINKDSLEVTDATGPIDINERIMAFITGQDLVTVKLKDVYDDKSGIESLYFKYCTENAEHTVKAEYDEKTGEYYSVISLPKNAQRKFSVIARDNLFNISVTEEDFINIIADNTNPGLEIDKKGNFYEDTNGDLVYKKDICFEVKAKDEVGIKEIDVLVNDISVQKNNDIYSKEGGLLKEYSFSFDKKYLTEEKNEIKIVARNYGGYETKEKLMVYSDNTAPIITLSNIDNTAAKIDKSSAGYYSNKDIGVSLRIVDYDDFGMERAGRVCDLKLLLYDIRNNPLDIKKLECDKDGNIKFSLKNGFKGYGVIKVNDTLSNELEFETRGFLSEGKEEFRRESAISLYDNGDNMHLSEVKMPIVVKSSFSGIKEVRYRIESPNDIRENKSGSLDISGKYEDGNLIYAKGELTVNNNSNDIKVSIELISNCNNKMEESIILNIDKTCPVLNVYFKDGKDDYYINHERTLQIEITERNFLRENLSFSIIENKTDIGKDLEFYSIKDENNPDGNMHIASVKLSNDGEYCIYGAVRDSAGNTATFKEKSFVIDKTAPIGEIIYERDIKDLEYINEPLSVKIRIKDDNLDVDSIKIEGVKNWDGSYSYEEGVYVTSLNFNESGEQQFTVTGKDLAKNQLNNIISKKFILDLTNPEILINNLINLKSYNDTLSFSGMIKDINLDTKSSQISLLKESGQTNLNLSKEISAESISFKLESIPKLSEYDGIYELKVLGVDLSGNSTEKTIRFSVNRFGSTFMPSKELSSVFGTYTRVIGNVNIEEVNYDVINPLSTRVFLFRNGDTKLLNMESDYEVIPSNNGFLNSLTYSIKGSNFDEDGIYAISIYSHDSAGNTNTTGKDESLLSFVVDRTPPRVYSLNVSENGDYKKALNMDIKAFDNMKFESLLAYNNDKPLNIERSDDKYKIHLPVSRKKYNIKLLATDSAGNSTEEKIGNISVGYEKNNNMTYFLLKISLLVIFLTSIIVVLRFVRRSSYGKGKDKRTY